MRKLLIIAVVVLTPSFKPATASVAVEKLLDSYMVAKVETQQKDGMSADDIKRYPYTVQVASYLNEQDAVSHVEELKTEAKDVRYFPTFVRGQIWYKVTVGKFDDTQKAEAYKNQISKKFDEPFAVVISLLDRPKVNEVPDYQRMPSAESNPLDGAVALKQMDDGKSKSAKKADVKVKDAAATPVPVPSAPTTPKATKTKDKMLVKIHKLSTEKPAVVDHYYALQLAAYATVDAAKKRINDLGIKDVELSYMTAQVNGQTWYRVLVGHFKTKKLALAYQATKGDLLKGAFVRRINVK